MCLIPRGTLRDVIGRAGDASTLSPGWCSNEYVSGRFASHRHHVMTLTASLTTGPCLPSWLFPPFASLRPLLSYALRSNTEHWPRTIESSDAARARHEYNSQEEPRRKNLLANPLRRG